MRQDRRQRVRGAVERVDTPDLPRVSWVCFRNGHAWPETPASRAVTGWGNVDAIEETAHCERDCGRWRREVILASTGDLLTRDYGGGTYAWAGAQPSRAEARAWMIRERRERELLQQLVEGREAAEDRR